MEEIDLTPEQEEAMERAWARLEREECKAAPAPAHAPKDDPD